MWILWSRSSYCGIADTVSGGRRSRRWSCHAAYRCDTRRGEGQQRADVDDMLELWAIIDAAQVKMPSFVATDLKRLPPTTMTEPDVCALAESVMELRCEMKSLINQLKVAGVLEWKGLQEVRDVGSSINVPQEVFHSSSTATSAEDVKDASDASSSGQQSSRMWADRAVNCASDPGAFQNKKQTSRVRVIGKKKVMRKAIQKFSQCRDGWHHLLAVYISTLWSQTYRNSFQKLVLWMWNARS